MALDPGDLADDQQPDNQQQQPPPTGQQQPPFTPESIQHELHSVRSEAAKYRTQNRDLRRLLAAVSGEEVPDGRPAPDLATLQSRFEKLTAGDQATIRGLKLDLGLERASRKHGVERPSVMKAFLADAGKLTGLDPAAETFDDDLSSLIEETLENAPELRGRASALPPQGTSAQMRHLTNQNQQQLTRQDLASMSPEEIDAARRAGQLNAILGRS